MRTNDAHQAPVSSDGSSQDTELEHLKARVRSLEQENSVLRAPRPRRISGRSIVAGVMLVIAVLLAPIAVIGTWARIQLVETDQFVATFAPLASDPAVQDFISDQVVEAVEEQLDVEALVGEVFDGIRDLDLAPRAEAALTILETPAAQGISSLIDSVVHDVVASEQFATIWAETLRFTHDRAVAIMQNDPDIAIQLDGGGVLSVDLGVVIERVKSELTDRGVGFADLIPVVDRSIPIAQADALVLVRAVYQIAVATGFWLPWLVVAFTFAGILLSRNRARATLRASVGLAVLFGLMAVGTVIGRTLFVGSVSPAVVPADAANVMYGQITEALQSTAAALALGAVVAAVWAWLSGASRSAATTREIAGNGFSSVRSLWERRGVTTGRLGLAVDRFRGPIVAAAIILAVLILIANRPVTFGAVVAASLSLLGLTLLVELLRRPQDRSDPSPEPVADGALDEPAVSRG